MQVQGGKMLEKMPPLQNQFTVISKHYYYIIIIIIKIVTIQSSTHSIRSP